MTRPPLTSAEARQLLHGDATVYGEFHHLPLPTLPPPPDLALGLICRLASVALGLCRPWRWLTGSW